MAFKKIRTTVNSNGAVEAGIVLDRMGAEMVEEDMARTRRELRQLAMGYGRIDTVEQTMTTMIILYTSGTVVVYQWVAE